MLFVVVVVVFVVFLCVCVFEEQQNVIYFVLENGDYEGYFCKL